MLLEQLKQALNPIVKLSRSETTVDVLGTTIHLRLLSPDEELQCQQEAQQFIADIDDEDEVEDVSRTKAIRFLDGFRLSILSRAIVQIDDLDLRETEYLETGEELSNGVKVKVLKIQAVREIIEAFPRQIQVALMQKFHILTESVSLVVGEQLEDNDDFSQAEAEILAMEEELERKKQVLETQAQQTEQDDVRKLMRTTANTAESYVSQRENTAQEIETKSKEAFQEREAELAEEEPVMEQPRVRTPITPTQATPPSVGAAPPPSRPEPVMESVAQPVQESVVEAPKPKAEPNIFQEQEFPQRTEPMGMQNGLEVYRLPTQEIGASQASHQATATTTTSRNPRFRPPNK